MSAPPALRPYQLRAVSHVRDAFGRVRDALRVRGEARGPRVLLVLPTGAGKTATASVLIARTVARAKTVLFLAHRQEIVNDTVARVRGGGIRTGVIMADEPADPGAPVQVASVQTIAERDLAPPADLVIWDEAHHVAAESYRAIAAKYPLAYHLGLTATPERSDRQGLRDAFDELVVGATIAELTTLGVLAPCDVVGPGKRQAKLSMAPFEAWQRWCRGRPTVAFCAGVPASRAFVAELAAVGVRAAHLDGNTPTRERVRILADFDAGRLDVISNDQVLTEGWDCARVEVILLARGTSAWGPRQQMVGRGRRSDPRNPAKRCLFIDLCGTSWQLGMPDEDFDFTLDGVRRKAGAAEWIRQCADCGAVVEGRLSPRGCPQGHPWPAPAPREVKRAAVGAITQVQSRASMAEEYARLCAVGRRKGWGPKVAPSIFKRKFGFWPVGFRSAT